MQTAKMAEQVAMLLILAIPQVEVLRLEVTALLPEVMVVTASRVQAAMAVAVLQDRMLTLQIKAV